MYNKSICVALNCLENVSIIVYRIYTALWNVGFVWYTVDIHLYSDHLKIIKSI